MLYSFLLRYYELEKHFWGREEVLPPPGHGFDFQNFKRHSAQERTQRGGLETSLPKPQFF